MDGAGGKISALLLVPAPVRKRIWLLAGWACQKTGPPPARLHAQSFLIHLKDSFFFGDVIFVALAQCNHLAQHLGVITA